MQPLSFQDAIAATETYSHRHLLLGNGFSIACRPNVFVYRRLFEQADFSLMSSSARQVFESLNTQDFERVIRGLNDSAVILGAYPDAGDHLPTLLKSDAEGLRELLVRTIATSHPAWPGEISDEEYGFCRRFLAHFEKVYTLNYDLLLYWAQMHTEAGSGPASDDGFRKPADNYDASYVTWEFENSYAQNTWFLHGALHLFDAGHEIQKYTWKNTGVRLIDQIRDALERGLFPIFVAEGTSQEKTSRIKHSEYLARAARSFEGIGGCLFVYGHSLAPNDDHILRRIAQGKIEHLFVGLHGEPSSDSNRLIIRRANKLPDERKRRTQLKVSFYDTKSADVWGQL